MGEPFGVSIGQAAALYDLAPSTLRWWESQQVLPEPPRVGGRRVYTETELRRIGLAYLCCVTGTMPLEQASVVTAGSRNRLWQKTVEHQAELIEEKIKQLQSARDYLIHLSQCPDDDIIEQCPNLDDELMRHTPRGRVPAPNFVAAAQTLPRPSADDRTRDEIEVPRDETIHTPSSCVVCAKPLTQPPQGRPRKYCSRACQQRHYRQAAK